jgi:hypothetical protein
VAPRRTPWPAQRRWHRAAGIGIIGLGIGPDAAYGPDAFPPLQRRRKIGVLAVLMTAPRYFRTQLDSGTRAAGFVLGRQEAAGTLGVGVRWHYGPMEINKIPLCFWSFRAT